VLEFGLLPPEISSGRMYAGPGAGPMLAAATAWDGLAAELGWTASSYGSVVSGLVGAPWMGPASVSMAAAAAPYVSWLSSTAAQAEETASQARAAAAAYEAAFAMTVPPPMIAANRVLLMTLIATNFFGQNTPAIMATEAQYAEMWAQDAAAMYGYAGASAAASAVPQFAPPAPSTDAAGLAEQAEAVGRAAVTPAGTAAAQTPGQAASTTPQLLAVSAVPQTVQSLSSSATATTPSSLSSLLPTPTNTWGLTPADYTAVIKQTLQAYFGVGLVQFFASIAQQLTFGQGTTAGAGGAWYPTPQFAGLGSGLGSLGGTSVSAGIGQAGSIGPLSVPPGWAASTAGANPTTSAAASLSAVSAAEESREPGGLLRGIPLSGATRRSATGFVHKYGFRYPVVPRPPSAG
jgi:PPE-repeat protein